MPGMRCCVSGCLNSRIKTFELRRKVLYHRIPSEKDREAAWCEAIDRKDFNPKAKFVCSDHFDEDDYVRDMRSKLLILPRRRKLKRSAVPHLKMRPEQGSPDKMKSNSLLIVNNNKNKKKGSKLATDQQNKTKPNRSVQLVIYVPEEEPKTVEELTEELDTTRQQLKEANETIEKFVQHFVTQEAKIAKLEESAHKNPSLPGSFLESMFHLVGQSKMIGQRVSWGVCWSCSEPIKSSGKRYSQRQLSFLLKYVLNIKLDILNPSFAVCFCEDCDSMLGRMCVFKNQIEEAAQRLWETSNIGSSSNVSSRLRDHNYSLNINTEPSQIASTEVVEEPIIAESGNENTIEVDTEIDSTAQPVGEIFILDEVLNKKLENDILSTDKLQCNFCSLRFETKVECYDHLESTHLNSRFLCDVCGASFSSRRVMLSHKRRHRDMAAAAGSPRCFECDMTFKNSRRRRVHMEEVHSAVGTMLSCQLCNKAFRWSKNLKEHLMKVHKYSFAFTCDACPQRYATRRGLLLHKKKTHLRGFQLS